MDLLTRRTFLEKLSVLAVGGITANSTAGTVGNPDSEPHIIFPAHPLERISIASYPFRAYIESPDNRDRDSSLPGMNLLEFPAHVAAKFHVHNIEPHSRHFTSLQPDYLEDFREALQKSKVRVVNIAVGAIHSFMMPMSTAASRLWPTQESGWTPRCAWALRAYGRTSPWRRIARQMSNARRRVCGMWLNTEPKRMWW